MTPAQVAEATLKAAQVQAGAAESQAIAAWVGIAGGLLTLAANVWFAHRSGVRERHADEQARVREARAEVAAQERIRAEDEAARRRTADEIAASEAREIERRRETINTLVWAALKMADTAEQDLRDAMDRLRQLAVAGDTALRTPAEYVRPGYRRELIDQIDVLARQGDGVPALYSSIIALKRAVEGDGDREWIGALPAAEGMMVISKRRDEVLAARARVEAVHISPDAEPFIPA